MAANRTSTRFNVRNDVLDNITPNWRVQDRIDAPSGPWRPAAWLPVQFTKTNIQAGTDVFVISSGKVVALDSQGKVVPAGWRGILNQSTGTTVLTYTQTDVDNGVIDLTTGDYVVAATSYTALAVAKALVERGLVDVAVLGDDGPPSTNGDVTAVAEAFISKAIGVVAHDVYKWAGLAEEGDQWFTNYGKQHAIQFLTEVQVAVPHMTHQTAGTTVLDVSAVSLTTSVTAGAWPVSGAVLDATGISTWDRYPDVGSTDELVAVRLSARDISKNTSRTPFTCDVDGVLENEKSSIETIGAEGDWYLDHKAGVLFLHSDTWDTLVANNTDPTFTFYKYAAGATEASQRHIHFTGSASPGARVSYNDASNFCVMASSEDVLGNSNTEFLGVLLRCQTEPFPLMAQVKSGFNLDNMSASGKMPGTATAGYSDKITLSGNVVADQIAVINVRI